MSKRFSILLVVLVTISSLIGSFMSGKLFTPKAAIAEEAKQNNVMIVEELRIVDRDGKVRIKLGSDEKANSYGFFLYDLEDNKVISLERSNSSEFSQLFLSEDFSSLMANSRIGITIFRNDTFSSMASLGIKESGETGFVKVSDYRNTVSSEMSTDSYGGWIGVSGKGSRDAMAIMSVNKLGNGAIGLWDKNGAIVK